MQPRYRIAKSIPFLVVGEEIKFNSQDGKYHYGYFSIPQEIIGQSDYFELIEEIEYSTKEVFDSIQRLVNEAQNKLNHAKHQLFNANRVEVVRMVEGIYGTACAVLKTNDVCLYVTKTTVCIYSKIVVDDTELKRKTLELNRKELESLSNSELVDKIYNTVVEIDAINKAVK